MKRTAPALAKLILVLSLTGCSGSLWPWKEEAAAPETPADVAAVFRTDPVTGRTDGPFDPETGRRMKTRTDEAGVLRVVLDPATRLPILLPPDDAAPTQ